MWGLSFRFSGGRLQSSVPGFLASAGASHYLVDYMERCAVEFSRDPDGYSFDPGSIYTVLVQTWDCAFSPARSVAFGRQKIGHEAVGLIPDFYYLASDGYRALRAAAEACPPWRERESTIVWRGSVTGRGPYERAEDIPRVRLALRSKSIAGMDVRLTGVHDTMRNALPHEPIAETLTRHDLVGEGWHMPHFGDFKYVVDIDGHANAWGLLEKLILGCCVLKVDTPYEQWFYSRLQPWVHYVPLRGDLSDLEAQIAWCHANEATCAWIAANGGRLAASMTWDAELRRSCEQILTVAHVAPDP